MPLAIARAAQNVRSVTMRKHRALRRRTSSPTNHAARSRGASQIMANVGAYP